MKIQSSSHYIPAFGILSLKGSGTHPYAHKRILPWDNTLTESGKYFQKAMKGEVEIQKFK